jgi:hypothetical protein
MIALCGMHHDKADAGAFTVEQLQELKSKVRGQRKDLVRGKFDWMRNRLLAVVGGSFFYETYIIFRLCGLPIIWFTRDEGGYLGLNIRMLSVSKEDRLNLEDNFWILKGEPIDFECPPSGKLIHAKYSNGDELRVEFAEIPSDEEARKRYPNWGEGDSRIVFPITSVEVQNRVADSNIYFDKDTTTISNIMLKGCFGCNASVALEVGSPSVPANKE